MGYLPRRRNSLHNAGMLLKMRRMGRSEQSFWFAAALHWDQLMVEWAHWMLHCPIYQARNQPHVSSRGCYLLPLKWSNNVLFDLLAEPSGFRSKTRWHIGLLQSRTRQLRRCRKRQMRHFGFPFWGRRAWRNKSWNLRQLYIHLARVSNFLGCV